MVAHDGWEPVLAVRVHTGSPVLSTVSSVTVSPPTSGRSGPRWSGSRWRSYGGIGALGRRHRAVVITVAILLVLVIVASEVSLPYYAISPGHATPVESMITVPESIAHRSHGSVLMTDVFVTPVRLIDLPSDWLSADTALLPAQNLLGGLSASEYTSLSLAEMRHSKLQAEVAALRYLGYPVPGYSGALIAKVLPGTPAAAAGLAAGQVITSINSRPTPDDISLVNVLGALKPGDLATLGIVEPSRASGSGDLGTPRTVTVRLGSRKLGAGRGDGPYLGVELAISRQERFKLPVAVSIYSGNIGGPSAGLAFTLGILDELTSGRLTAGRTVAATGTIRIDGTIGEVGGVAQKTVAVERGGASIFIVPAGEVAQARSHANGHLEVLGVKTLAQAVGDLMRLGGRLGPRPGSKFPPRRRPAS